MWNQSKEKQPMTRRTALKYMGAGLMGTAGIFFGLPAVVQSCFNKTSSSAAKNGAMATRKDKTLGMEISMLGFGCMRLPLVAGDKPYIDEAQSMELIDYAYKHGVNYFDTAYFYHQGLSETFLGKALQSYPRESFFLADKMPTPRIESLAHARSVFDEQLHKCRVDCFDFYLLHTLGEIAEYDRVYEEYGVYEYLKSEKDKGRIKRLGFRFTAKRKTLPTSSTNTPGTLR